MKKEKIIQELYSIGIQIDLKNPADIYFLNIIEEKTGEDRKKFFDFFVNMRLKDLKEEKKYNDFFYKITGEDRIQFQKKIKKQEIKKEKKSFWKFFGLGALFGLFFNI